ncbi:hypothetical protein [Rhodococcus erythropolis]|uniref:hypothetical protein n=1 Tax=Rhodococcus erythropolis TaxID=1833 RepID=UPI0018A2C40E|nr:hypothetical protein [Rhodococcus erythropolis]MBF7733803.1 hypothetical protein [Rhodococcus erythropolis]MCZ4639411.1 hypothetical protein [Rhodococcus erythropolis]
MSIEQCVEARSGTRRRLLAVALATASAAALAGCTIPTRDESSEKVETITEIVVVPPEPTETPAAPGNGAGPLAGFEALGNTLGGAVGIALVPVGGGQSLVAGEWQNGVAWSTIKVPLSIAALHETDNTQLTTVEQAITTSDNESAEELWRGLGDPTTAAAKVESVLVASGDMSTTVESRTLRPEFSSFGQTQWPLAVQAQFAATLPCRSDAIEVFGLMGSISPDQHWGLGVIPTARFKGGWGPDDDGGYLVRQFGIISSGTGQLAVAIAAKPDSGTFADGTAMLSDIGRWVGERAQALPIGGTCQPS